VLTPGGHACHKQYYHLAHNLCPLAVDTRIDKHDRLTQQLKQERKELGNYCADLLER
jgi:hypothetical protein